MIPFLVLLGCLLVAYVVVSRFSGIFRSKVWLWVLGGLCVVSLALVIVAKNYNLLLAGLPFLLPLLLPSTANSKRTNPSPSQSEIQTAFLKMTLDHTTNQVQGIVKSGRFQGRLLDSLSDDDLTLLLQECATQDPQSVQLLEAWLDQKRPGWRQASSPPSSEMSKEYAYQILGLSPDATEDEIKRAYHTLIKKVHPDQGGSAILAAQINQARDLLLGKKKPPSL